MRFYWAFAGASLTGVADSGKYHGRYCGVKSFLVHTKLEDLARDLLAFQYWHLHEIK
jgi:hypothetical protein